MEELLEILEGINPDVDFASCKALIDDGLLTSLDIVSIIAELSEHYDIRIGAKYIVPENFNSAEALLALVEKLQEE